MAGTSSRRQRTGDRKRSYGMPQGTEMQEQQLKIYNRRYLGSKSKLLPWIRKITDAQCGVIHTVADLFAGTGAVASAFTDKKLITNDIMYSNYICHTAWFGPEAYDQEKIIRYTKFYNETQPSEENYMTEHFSGTFFSPADCCKIGFIRQHIETLFQNGAVNPRERAILIMSLLYAMDRSANTCGHYDAYRKGAVFSRPLLLKLALPPVSNNANNLCYQMDANQLVREIEADLVYLDPPYNSRQYCDAYHLPENVARWEKPPVAGTARKMADRAELKSAYCTAKAGEAFADLIRHIKAKYILLSYNNMAEKGDGRSNAKLSDEEILRILSRKGEVQVFSKEYKAFSAGKSDIRENQERLFLCRCFDAEKERIQSPLNYVGGKFKLLPQLLPMFPKKVDLFVDLFCGGCNVGINADCSRVLFNDLEPVLPALCTVLRRLGKDTVFARIQKIITDYGLSCSQENGYAFYGCDSASGLSRYNRAPYLRLREDFNRRLQRDDDYYLMLYVLIVYAFNNQIRFNQSGAFNLPVGKRDFNAKMQRKLAAFTDRLRSGDYQFTSQDFRSFDIGRLSKNSFVYADPPYLITCAPYNEQGGWTEACERDLLAFLDRLQQKKIKFALSNVLSSKGKTNHILQDWAAENAGRYRIIELNFSYANSNYQTKNRTRDTREVLIVNYDPGTC